LSGKYAGRTEKGGKSAGNKPILHCVLQARIVLRDQVQGMLLVFGARRLFQQERTRRREKMTGKFAGGFPNLLVPLAKPAFR
jgi:hypothetical protein